MVNSKMENIIGQAVAEAEYWHSRNKAQIALEACLRRLHDRRADVENAFDTLSRKAACEEVLVILGSEISEALKGKLIAPEYSQKSAAKQVLYVYVGTHWEVTKTQIYYDYVKEACRRVGLSEVYVQDPVFMNKVFEKVAFIVSHHISTAQPHDGVWINLRNCTVEILADGTLSTHEHRPEDFFLYCLPYSYDAEARCEKWTKFLNDVLPDKVSQTVLAEYIGYCFTTSMKLEKMLVLFGGGANGKSVCMDVIKQLFGRSNISEATLSSITNDPEARTVLENKLVNISSESGRNLNAAVLKMMISGEPVEMRKLYVGTKTLYNPPKLITSYNELPPIENTHGYKRRWILMPFKRTIADNEQDPALSRKLTGELPGILNWVLMHLQKLVQRVSNSVGEGFTYSEECDEALKEYFKTANTAMLFFEECCKTDDTVLVKLKDLYVDYQNYCRESGVSKPVIKKNFKKIAQDWGAAVTNSNGVVYFNVVVDRAVYS